MSTTELTPTGPREDIAPASSNSVAAIRLSVIIPTLHEEANIRRAVEAAWALQPYEVIVSDGDSQDATRDLAHESGAVVLNGPCGRGVQLNAGARRATGEVLLFLHADTSLANAAAEQLAAALSDPATNWGAFRQQIPAPGLLYRALEWGNAFRVTHWKLPYGDQAMFVRRDMFNAIGGFPETPLMEDAELSTRLRRRSKPCFLPGPVTVSPRRWQRNGVVRQTLKNWAILTAWRLGVSPQTLAGWYRPDAGTHGGDDV